MCVIVSPGVVRSSSGLHGNQPIPFIAPNSLMLQPVSSSYKGTGFNPDTAPPYLIQFSLDMNIQTGLTFNASFPIYGVLTMVFSEPMDVSNFHLSGLTLQNTPTYSAAVTKSFSLVDDPLDLKNGSVVSDRAAHLYTHYYSYLQGSVNLQRTVMFVLGSSNMDGLKSLAGLCTTPASCYLSGYSNRFAHDISHNNVSLIGFDKYNAVKVSLFNPDVTAPTLLYWTYNSNTATIELVFSESLYMIFFKYESILLLNKKIANFSASSEVLYIRVRDPVGIGSAEVNTNVVRFTLNAAQQTAIRSLPDFMRTQNDSFVYLEDGIVVDTSRLQNVSTTYQPNPMYELYIQCMRYLLRTGRKRTLTAYFIIIRLFFLFQTHY